MINKFKTAAFAMLAAGATVTSSMAKTITYSDTNALQTVTVKLTVYADKTGTNTLATGAAASFTTANLLTIVTNALGGSNSLGEAFSKNSPRLWTWSLWRARPAMS